MSEYQYYEFLSIDRLLSDEDRRRLRNLSTQAEITSTSFTNVYHWGDFGGDPVTMMKNWLDMHLYRANWPSNRLMIKLPSRLVESSHYDHFLKSSEVAGMINAGDNVILDVWYTDEDGWDTIDDELDDLSPFAPLRNDLLRGDLRSLYVIWLAGVEDVSLREDALEPIVGIAPLTQPLINLAELLCIDKDLVLAAAEECPDNTKSELPLEFIRDALTAIPDEQKVQWLHRLYEGDTHLSLELRKQIEDAVTLSSEETPIKRRSVLELRERALAIRKQREAEEEAQAEMERKKEEFRKKQAQRRRLDAIREKGIDHAWKTVEYKISWRNRESYNAAANMLSDMQILAQEDGATEQFENRLEKLKMTHRRKPALLECLQEKSL